MQSSQNSSQDQLLLCCSYPSFQDSKRKSKTFHLPPPPSPSAPGLGRARLDTALLLRFTPDAQGEEEKSRNGQMAILNMWSKFCIQLCPSYFNNHSRVIKIMIKWETRTIHTAGKVPPSGATRHHLWYFCVFLPLVHILVPVKGLWGCLFPSPPRTIEDLAKNPK